MTKRKYFFNRIKISLFLLIFLPSVAFALSVPSWLIDAAWDFATNYEDVFYNFHLDNVDYSPVFEAKKATLRTNFLTTFMPFTWANLNLNVKVFSERYHSWIPQVDIVAEYGRMFGLDIASAFVSSETFKSPPSLNDYNVGILLTKSVSKETRLYTGVQYSVVNLSLKLPESIDLPEPFDEIFYDLLTQEGLNVGRKDFILVTGISNMTDRDRHLVAYMGYGFKYRKIFSRFAWHYEHLELGFNIYPEGLLVIHPFLGWHWNF